MAGHRMVPKAPPAVVWTLALGFGTFTSGPIWAQSPYSLLGTDAQAAGPIGWVDEAPVGERVAGIFDAWAMQGGFHGVALAAMDGQIVHRSAHGWANVEHRVPNGLDTRFRLGLVSMRFTAAAVGTLADAGRVDLHAPASEYLPDLPRAIGRVSLWHMLRHESGFDQDLFRYTNKTARDPVASFDEILNTLQEIEVFAEPGERTVWSSTAGSSTEYVVLAAIVEEVSGQSLEAYVRSSILEPVGLEDTGYLTEQPVVEGLASAYQSIFGELEHFPSTEWGYARATTAMYSTAEDLYRFLTKVIDQEALGPLTAEVVDVPRVLGIRDATLLAADSVSPADRYTVYTSDGWNRGQTAMFTHFRERGHTVIVLSNVHRATQIYDMRRRWARLLFDLPVGMPLPNQTQAFWDRLRDDGTLQALALYQTALSSGQPMPLRDEFMHHSRELRRQRRFEEALSVTEFFVALEPDGYLPHRELGEVYRAMGRAEDARDAFVRSLELGPDDPAWAAEMRAYIERGERR